MKNFCISLLLFTVFTVFKSRGQEPAFFIPKTTALPIIDGVLGEEWKDAKEILLKGLTDQEAKVLVKYDTEHLYIAFQNLINEQQIRFNPEVLINTATKNTIWNENSYWFHASYSNCSAIGEYYNWEDCSINPIGWKANTFPFKNDNNNIEFRISFKKLQITPATNTKLRIAFKLSDPLEQHFYWPESAIISEPSTWEILKF